MNVIPAIDLHDGRCVRLRQGNFERQTIYDGDPLRIAAGYRGQGLKALHVVDLDGARTGVQRHRPVVESIVRETGLAVQLGGGIRDRGTVAGWLGAGVARCVVGSMAVSDPRQVAAWLDEFGADSIVLALDVRTQADRDPLLAVHGWATLSSVTLWQAIERFQPAGLRHVLCTDVARDGMADGPNVPLYQTLAARYPETRVQASGGVRDLADLAELRAAGCDAAITGRALLDGTITPAEVVSFLRGE